MYEHSLDSRIQQSSYASMDKLQRKSSNLSCQRLAVEVSSLPHEEGCSSYEVSSLLHHQHLESENEMLRLQVQIYHFETCREYG